MATTPGPEPVPESPLRRADRGRGIGIDDVAASIGKSTKTVRRLVQSGELPAFRIASKLTFFEADLEAFIEARRISCGGAA